MDNLLPIATELPIAEVVGEDKNDVWFRRLAERRRSERERSRSEGRKARMRTTEHNADAIQPCVCEMVSANNQITRK